MMAKKGRRGGITDDRGKAPRSLKQGSSHARKPTGKSGAAAAKPHKVKNY